MNKNTKIHWKNEIDLKNTVKFACIDKIRIQHKNIMEMVQLLQTFFGRTNQKKSNEQQKSLSNTRVRFLFPSPLSRTFLITK